MSDLWLRHTEALHPDLKARIRAADEEVRWLRAADANALLRLAADALKVEPPPEAPFAGIGAVDFANLARAELVSRLAPRYEPGTSTAEDLADQVQLCRAFGDPSGATSLVADAVLAAVARFPATAEALKVGHNPGDVLDPFILAANFELLSERSIEKTIETSASHKVLMKVEDLIGNLHQNVIGMMRGNFRVPEPKGTKAAGKERLDPVLNPFPGADIGQVPVPERPDSLRLFQVKSKTGSAKGGDGKRLGEQLRRLAETYGADTFYTAVVGNTLRGHRSKGAVLRESPSTAVLVGEAALDELTQSAVGAELLLRTYQRAFRRAARETEFRFSEVVVRMSDAFRLEADTAGEDFLSAWLHGAVGGARHEQDSRHAGGETATHG